MNILIHIVILLNTSALSDFHGIEKNLPIHQSSFALMHESSHVFLSIEKIFSQRLSIKCIKEEEKIYPDLSHQKRQKPSSKKTICFTAIVVNLCSIQFADNILFETDTSPPMLYPCDT